jgi:heat-inducible transcriptional repressor
MSIGDARAAIEKSLVTARAELDQLTQKVIQAGLAEWSGALDERKSLIVRGQANLLKDLTAIEDLERIRQLFDDLEAKRDIIQLLGLAERAEGVRIFIGSENKLFSLSGSSLIVSPFQDTSRKIVGVLGVIGPTRLNYARIIPMVDYTAKLVGRLLT